MKHSFLGMSVLAIVVTLACCSKNDAGNDSQDNLVDRKTNQYRTDFEAKYGKVGSTQSWDFSGVSTTTRAAASTTVSNIKDPEFFQNYLHNDIAGLKAGISNAQELDWNPNVSVNLYPAFCHDELMRNQYLCLEVNNMALSTIQIKDNAWWNKQGATAPSQKGKSINTTDMTNPAWTIAYFNDKQQLQGRVDIRNYKEVVVNGRTYWCFDYDGNAGLRLQRHRIRRHTGRGWQSDSHHPRHGRYTRLHADHRQHHMAEECRRFSKGICDRRNVQHQDPHLDQRTGSVQGDRLESQQQQRHRHRGQQREQGCRHDHSVPQDWRGTHDNRRQALRRLAARAYTAA